MSKIIHNEETVVDNNNTANNIKLMISQNFAVTLVSQLIRYFTLAT